MGTAADKRTNINKRNKEVLTQTLSSLESSGKDDGQPKFQKISCSNCGIEAKCRRRTFSEQAWTVLLLWNEVSPKTVDQPICEDCYTELRDVLIDRTDEIESAMQQSDEIAKVRKHLGSLAS